MRRFHDLLKYGLPDLPGGPAPNDTYFHPGQHIACQAGDPHHHPQGHICVFLEGDHLSRAGMNTSMIVEKLDQLVRYGCRKCGSVNIDPFGPYDVSKVAMRE